MSRLFLTVLLALIVSDCVYSMPFLNRLRRKRETNETAVGTESKEKEEDNSAFGAIDDGADMWSETMGDTDMDAMFMSEINQAFAEADSDKNGGLTAAEIKASIEKDLQDLKKMVDDAVDETFASFDKDGNKELSLNETIDGSNQLIEQMFSAIGFDSMVEEADDEEHFKAADADENGLLTLDELKKYIRKMLSEEGIPAEPTDPKDETQAAVKKAQEEVLVKFDQMLTDFFPIMDTDKSGQVSLTEMEASEDAFEQKLESFMGEFAAKK